MPSATIQRGLDELEIDAGVTYLDSEPLSRVRTTLLYEERYSFVTSAGWFAEREEVRWAEAAARPLCLLTRDMQSRRIIDRIFAEAGISSPARVEANSFEGIRSMIATGAFGSIMPSAQAEACDGMKGIRALPLVDPVHTQLVGLAISDRDPGPPVAAELMRQVARRKESAKPVPLPV